MLRSIIRTYTSALFFSLRKDVKVTTERDVHVYEQTYAIPEVDAKYKIKVSESVFSIKYKYFFLTLKRKIYRADLTYSQKGFEDRHFTASYPALNMGLYLDPLYPLSIIASMHLDAFLDMEKI